ncbi:MAG: hypothetical protein GVY26_00960 [Bacteroidetes bacterium]|nr:hypothetical protein [Bacteroidota bacterium]
MIFIHTNLEAWEQDGVLNPFALKTNGESFQPHMGITEQRCFCPIPENKFGQIDIVLSHEGNYIEETLDLPLPKQNTQAIFLLLHRDSDILVFNRLAVANPDQRIYCRFETIREDTQGRNGRALLKDLGIYHKKGDSKAYRQRLHQFTENFESNALNHFKAMVDERLEDMEDCLPAQLSESNLPFLWKVLFRAYPDLQDLIPAYFALHPGEPSKGYLRAKIKQIVQKP